MTVRVYIFAQKQEYMTIIEFINRFSVEESCKLYYRNIRQKEGVICKKYGCKRHYWLKNKWQFQCSNCNFRTTLRSGTVMGQRDDLYILEDMIEFDESCFETAVSAKNKEKLKQGRGSQRQTNVAVMAESVPLENIETGQQEKQCRYFKMKVLSSYQSSEINGVVEENISPDAILFTDKSSSYLEMSDFIEMHISEKSSPETTVELLKWVHIAISNAKRNLLVCIILLKGSIYKDILMSFVINLTEDSLNLFLKD